MYINEETVGNALKNVYSDYEIYEHRGQLTIIFPQQYLKDICTVLKTAEETNFDQLIDITAIDWYEKKDVRFEAVYFLYSNKHKHRLRLKTAIEEKECTCPSVTDIWESANWYERETFDMYGIKFEGHPGLRRFYMPEDFSDPSSGEPYYPLRKDFPMMGVPGSVKLPPFPERDGERE